MAQTKYKVLRDRSISGELFAAAGTLVYSTKGHDDYGVAGDDTRYTGIEHVSVTLDEDGGYPFFTIPKRDLAKVVD